MSEAKYICGELPAAMGTCYGAIIFPPYMEHSLVAKALNIEVDSAGMCSLDDAGKWGCYGKSTSLQVESKESDSSQLNKLGRYY